MNKSTVPGAVEMDHRCWSCGKLQSHASGVGEGVGMTPKTGDVGLCIGCGEWGLFDPAASDGFRKPTDDEFIDIAASDECRRAREAWLKIKDGPEDVAKATAAASDRAMYLYDLMRPILAGEPPEVQGSALALTVATWKAGFFRSPRAFQRQNWEKWVKTTLSLSKTDEAHFRKLTGEIDDRG